ncbi:MAG: hypothetical protein RL386_1866 [Bacteroidota bacterium]
MQMDIKNEVLYRVYLLLFGLFLPVAALLLYRTVQIGILEGGELRDKLNVTGKPGYLDERDIEAERGNVLSADGSLLATSIPYFDLYFDAVAPSERDFNLYVDSLALCWATFIDDTYTPGGLREHLLRLRASNIRYFPVKSRVSYAEKHFIENFPLFRLGQFRGGLITKPNSDRRRPFGVLAQRTIGYVRDGIKPVGLEGYFDTYLRGEPGRQVMLCVDRSKDIWLPVKDLAAIEPKSGADVRTTIDVNLQDIVENALLRAMNYHEAEWGTAILMEVKTGAIKAIANLGKMQDGWWETYNFAVGYAEEPGSTFKTATMLAMLEDGLVKLEDSIDIEKGKTIFYEDVMVDASPESAKLDSISVRKIFEISSNVGMAKLVNQFYNQPGGAERFIRRLHQFNLHLPTGIEIEGEAAPYIKTPSSAKDRWSGITLPWMAIGYELRLTPLQQLAFYNAIANNGRMMRPYLVDEILSNGKIVEKFQPTVVKKAIASGRSMDMIRELLAGVVERGTAEKISTAAYDFSGKTGTAQINYRRTGARNRIGGYRASFAGFFPSDNPVYSCIVVINNPTKNGYYGSDVAGPVFREISDKCYYATLEIHPPVNAQPAAALPTAGLPAFDIGYKADMQVALDYLGLSASGNPPTKMAVLSARRDSLKMERRTILEGRVPNVQGMGLKDALYVLENAGLKVEARGVGRVTLQSLRPGTPCNKQTIAITLK